LRRAARRLALLAVALLCCCEPLPTAPPEGTVVGRFNTRLSKMDLEAFDTTTCESGEHQSFLGADLRAAENGPVVRIVIDPLTGPAVRVFDPADPARRTATYRRNDCRKFEVELEDTGWKVNELRDYRVTLDIQCEHGNGSYLAGSAKLEHCH